MTWLVFDNFIFLFETMLMIYLAQQFLGARREGRLKAAVYIGLLLVIHKIVAVTFWGSMELTAVFSGLADYFLFGILWPKQRDKRLFIICLYYAAMMMIDLLLIFTVPVSSVPISEAQYQAAGMIVSRLLLAVLVIMVSRIGGRIGTAKRLFLFVAPLPALLVIVLLISYCGYEVDEVTANQSMELTIIVILIITLVLLCVYMKLARNEEVLEERIRMQEELQSEQEKYCTALLKSYESIRSTRHDLHHYLDAIAVFTGAGQYEEIQNICSHARQCIGESLISTGNEMVDAIIYSKQALFERMGAVADIDGALPGTLKYSAADICVVLSNALENAAEAVAVLPPDQRVVHVRFRYEGWLLITVENAVGTIPKQSHGRFISGKGPAHGIGIENMKAACERQNGYLETTIKDGMFIMAATMQPE